MVYRQLARFMPDIKRIGFLAASIAVLLIFTNSICFCAQPRQNPATDAGQSKDANSVSTTVPVPQDAPIVDTNVCRLIQRIFGIQGAFSKAQIKKRVWHIATKIIPAGKTYIFNQALLDFGALVCLARNPVCPNCFINQYCEWLKDKNRPKRS